MFHKSGTREVVRNFRYRLKIWEIRDNLECSLIGTCLSDGDLKTLLKRCKLRPGSDLPSYELHGYFTHQIKSDNALARATQKMLDRRHEGAVRLVGRSEGGALTRLWETEFAAGRIPGAYWAFLTHNHIPTELHARIFGEVHMLSHVLGRTVHSTAARASEYQSRILDLEEKLARQSKRHAALLEERDAKNTALQEALLQQAARSCQSKTKNTDDQRRRYVTKQDRALAATRERAKRAEARAEALEGQRRLLRMPSMWPSLPHHTGVVGPECAGAVACRLSLAEGEALKVLYLGGRTGGISKLRAIAENASAEWHHHDGGQQQAFSRIDGLVGQCHVVFCPIDCISHRACLYAKDLCRRRQKVFVPLRSSGGVTFARALNQIEVV